MTIKICSGCEKCLYDKDLVICLICKQFSVSGYLKKNKIKRNSKEYYEIKQYIKNERKKISRIKWNEAAKLKRIKEKKSRVVKVKVKSDRKNYRMPHIVKRRRKQLRNAYAQERRRGSQEKIRNTVASRMTIAIKVQNGSKLFKTSEILGCTIQECKEHLERQFKEGMTWDNHGRYGWHIDHIIPCDSFDLTDPEQQKKCFHYTNLQPLWAKDNLSKSNKLNWRKEA